MGMFAGNVFGTGENPVVTAAKGELFVPIGDENHPPLARRIMISFCVFAVVIGAVFFINHLHREHITLPQFNGDMIGKSVAQIGDVPESVRYADVEFCYEVTEFEGLVTGCRYTAQGSVEDLSSVVRTMLERYGEPGDFNKMALSVLTQADAASLDNATWTWVSGESFNAESLEALDNWGSYVAGYYIHPTKLYLDLNVTADTDGELNMVIRYEACSQY